MTGEYTGLVGLVTGAGSGIGEGCARRLAHAGAHVVVADIDGDAAKRVADDVCAAGGEAMPLAVDVTDAVAVAEAVGATVAAYGRLDLAVNNAGVSAPRAPVERLGIDDWKRVIDVNLSGVFYCMRAEIPAMLAAGGGSIVNMASMFGLVAFPETPAYVAAKHGVIGLTKTAALDNATRNIRINAVAPGFVDTPMIQENGRRQRAAALLHPTNRLCTVEEVAEVVLFLLSSRASAVTGSVYLADGAFTAR